MSIQCTTQKLIWDWAEVKTLQAGFVLDSTARVLGEVP